MDGHRLNPSYPSIPQGALGGGGVTHLKVWESCRTAAPIGTEFSIGNGHRVNTIRLTIPQGHFGGGVLGGSQTQKFGEAVKQLD